MRNIERDARSTSASDSRSLSGMPAIEFRYSALDRMLESGFLRSCTISVASSRRWRCTVSSSSRCERITS
jgi:hypothetical protein